ncbi:unnamed protein product [Nippostrongylus brasiliensis]|uniref:DUF725 domain-containing protein n=1 Tax=Nippostrongylus brasiliensis TaxID=27835 RepID=A0A0N4YNN7_NIPBR|nr:hypothetical protein Q1695_004147 [Nippostrongylus brasiliensis]VDL82577.1 unnamed protein product [Nippostrongylus brasiliensis]
MVGVRLLFITASALFISDGSRAQPADNLKCAYRGGNFCYQVKAAHKVNQQALNRLDGVLDGEGRRKLAEADKLVMELLTKAKQDLLASLKEALKAELGALDSVKVDCYRLSKEHQLSKESTCRAVYDDIGYGTDALIKAIIEIDPSKETKIQTLYTSTILGNKIHEVVTAVLGDEELWQQL